MPGLYIGKHQLVLGREVIVETFLGHADVFHDGVNARADDPVGLEQFCRGVQLSRGVLLRSRKASEPGWPKSSEFARLLRRP